VIAVERRNASETPNYTTMKPVKYYLIRAARLASLPQSKNVMRLRKANHIAAGVARQYELAAMKTSH
jgi:hypothetical protein